MVILTKGLKYFVLGLLCYNILSLLINLCFIKKIN
jgi:hypothetical protein